MNAVSVRKINEYHDCERKFCATLTMPTAQCAEVVRYPIQVVSVWRYLCSRIVSRQLQSHIDARRQWRRHIVGQIETPYWVVDKCLNLVRKVALRRKSLQVYEEDRRETRQRQVLGCLPKSLAMRAVPICRVRKYVGYFIVRTHQASDFSITSSLTKASKH